MNDVLMQLEEALVLRHTDPTGLFGLWGARPVRALDGVSLTFLRGEMLGIMGGSGSGKSTLAEIVTLRRACDRGRLLFSGQDIARLSGSEKRKLRRRMQLIPQDPRAGFEPERSVRRQLQDQLRQHGLSDAGGRIARALAQVELPEELLDRTLPEMSGGQQQRLAIARALTLGPVLLAADEPFSGVDPHLGRELMSLIDRVRKEQNMTCLLVSQNRWVIGRMAERVAVLHAGRLLEIGPAERVLQGAAHPYTRLFLELEQGTYPADEDRAGQVTPGCPWAAHCHLVRERCHKAAPDMQEIAPGHLVACHAL